MARIRTIKPEFWVDDVMADLEPLDKLLYIGLWNFVDDDGYLEYSVRRIKMMVFPGNDYDVHGALVHLIDASRIVLWASDQGPLLQVVNFRRHQKISHPTDTKFTGIRAPDSVSAPEHSGKVRRIRDDSALIGRERKGKEVVQTEFERDFDAFWIYYPRKQAKQPAKKKYLAIRKTVPAKVLLDGAQAYALMTAGKEREHIKLAAGWLADARWEDTFETSVPLPPRASVGMCPLHDEYPLPCDACARGGNPF